MGLRELKAEYVAAYEGKSPKGLSTRLDEGIEYFEARGISLPSESDIQAWSEEQKTRPGRKSGQTRSEATIKDYAREFRKFIDWCKQKGERSMTLDFEATQPVAEASPEDNMEVTEATEESEASLSAPVEATQPVHERASEATQGVHEPESEATEATEATKATQPVEVEQPEDTPETTHSEGSLEFEPVTETMPEGALEFAEDTPKRRGRKSKPEADRRSVKISIYLTPSLYEGVRLLAASRKEDISDVIFSVLDDFVDRNSDKISTVRDFFASLGVIK